MKDSILKKRGHNLLTSREAATMLRVHIYTINDLLRVGKLKGFKIKKRWRIYKDSLTEFMKTEK